jgi:hypothetical protein
MSMAAPLQISSSNNSKFKKNRITHNHKDYMIHVLMPVVRNGVAMLESGAVLIFFSTIFYWRFISLLIQEDSLTFDRSLIPSLPGIGKTVDNLRFV